MEELAILGGFSGSYLNMHSNFTLEQIRSVKLVEYIKRTTQLDERIASYLPEEMAWKEVIEGNTLGKIPSQYTHSTHPIDHYIIKSYLSHYQHIFKRSTSSANWRMILE